MSTHIGAEPDEIAPRIMLPGDPLRARWIAQTFFEGAQLYNEVRGMFGYTGTYKGERVSVQGTGMGMPSISIYATELMADYEVQQLVRVGSCGALDPDLALRDVVIAPAAATDSSMNQLRFQGIDYPATADYELLSNTVRAARKAGRDPVVRSIVSSDSFYSDRPELVSQLVEYGVVAVEMEAHALYTLAAKYDCRALAICTVSDHIVSGAAVSAHDREQSFTEMVEIALDGMLRTPLP